MACAKPIILPIDGAVKEIVIDQAMAGVFIHPNNIEEFENAIIKLKNNTKECRKLGQNGYKFVIKNFDRKKLAEKYLEIINNLAKNE